MKDLKEKVDKIDRKTDELAERFENSDQKLQEKLDKVQDKVNDISESIIKNSVILEEHQRRSIANENAVTIMRAELDPIKRHVAMWGGVFKAGAAIGGTVAVITGIIEIMKAFGGQ